jgi:iron complex outermembrane receptor protein
LDATSAGGFSVYVFFGHKFNTAGVTLFASRNSNPAYDPAGIGLTAIPEYERYTVNPKLFIYFSPQTEMIVGVNISTEKRTGGEMAYIKRDNPSGFFETNNSDRYSTEFTIRHQSGSNRIQFKNSFNRFQRSISSRGYAFNGKQNASFSELTYSAQRAKAEWIAGVNLVTDDFRELIPTLAPSRNYGQLTTGIFVQNNWKATEKFRLESGLRGDYTKDFGLAFLPRISALFKINSKLSSRIGGGLGYKAPTIFTEESERMQYKAIFPIDKDSNRLERSYGVNADINYKTKFPDGAISFSINHLFFYTRIEDPLLLQVAVGGYRFNNVKGHIDTKGMETNLKLGYKDFKLFLGYTFTNAYLHQGSHKQETFLTPRHRLNNVLMYESEGKWKLGLEAYYFSKQELSDGTTGRSYWITGFMAEWLWKKFSLYINFENFLDTRQTRFGSIYTGPASDPQFNDIYAPLDGFVVNGGIKLKL